MYVCMFSTERKSQNTAFAVDTINMEIKADYTKAASHAHVL